MRCFTSLFFNLLRPALYDSLGVTWEFVFKGFTITPYICLLSHPAPCIFCWSNQYIEEKEMLWEPPALYSQCWKQHILETPV